MRGGQSGVFVVFHYDQMVALAQRSIDVINRRRLISPTVKDERPVDVNAHSARRDCRKGIVTLIKVETSITAGTPFWFQYSGNENFPERHCSSEQHYPFNATIGQTSKRRLTLPSALRYPVQRK